MNKKPFERKFKKWKITFYPTWADFEECPLEEDRYVEIPLTCDYKKFWIIWRTLNQIHTLMKYIKLAFLSEWAVEVGWIVCIKSRMEKDLCISVNMTEYELNAFKYLARDNKMRLFYKYRKIPAVMKSSRIIVVKPYKLSTIEKHEIRKWNNPIVKAF